MMVIERLSPLDVESALPGAKEFYSKAPLPGELNEDHFVSEWARILSEKKGIALVARREDSSAPVAGLAGYLGIDPVTGEKVFKEAWFFSMDGNHGDGRQLLWAMEEALRGLGVKFCYMASLLDFKATETANLYGKNGYIPKEVFWLKEM